MSDTTDPDGPGDGDGDEGASSPSPAHSPTPSRLRRRHLHIGLGAAVIGAVVLLVLIVARPAPPATPAAAAPPTILPPATGTTASTTTTEAPPTTTEPPPADGVTTTTKKPRPIPTGPPGPLTGMPVDLPGYERRPALILKIDNLDPDARPQSGLTLADIVYEEKVEGPYSRFAAVFQGSDADPVGPIRSARSTDVQIMGPLQHPLFGYSGANGGFLALLSISPMIDVGAGARGGAYYRGGDKVIPHNLFTSTNMLYSGTSGYVPKPLWAFRGPKDAPGPNARAATSATYHFGGGVTLVNWTWDADQKAFLRTQNGSPHYDTDNWQVAAANVVLQYVPYQASTSADIFGNPIPEASLGGTGRGWLLSGGAAVPMTWSRFGLEEPTHYLGADGKDLRFAPGRTWVILVPQEYPALIRFADGGAAS